MGRCAGRKPGLAAVKTALAALGGVLVWFAVWAPATSHATAAADAALTTSVRAGVRASRAQLASCAEREPTVAHLAAEVPPRPEGDERQLSGARLRAGASVALVARFVRLRAGLDPLATRVSLIDRRDAIYAARALFGTSSADDDHGRPRAV